MSQPTRPFQLVAVALAASMMLSACGGGDAEAPPITGTAPTPAPGPAPAPTPAPPAPAPAPTPPAPAPAPTPGGTVLASFDEATPLVITEFGGAGYAADQPGPAGGDGNALAITRSGGEVFAGAFVTTAPIAFSPTRRSITMRVYSPAAGTPMVVKAEYDVNAGTVDTLPTTAVVQGWQTLTFTFNDLDFTKSYTRITLLPNLGTVGTGETYYFDDITLAEDVPVAPAPPADVDLVLASFDEATPPLVQEFGGAGYAADQPGPAGGGSGNALAITRPGGEVFAGAFVNVSPIPFSSTRKTITARVYSPAAGVPMIVKAEFADNAGTGDTAPQEAVVQGWQTLTWVFNNVDLTKSYTRFTILPDLGTVGTGQTYYFDDITLLAETEPVAGGGGGGGEAGPTPAGGDMGSGGPQALTVATGDVKTGDGGNTMFVAGEGLFAVNYVGSAESTPPFNLAAWQDATTADFAGITGISNGDIGYFQDDVNLSNASEKVDEGGWVSGTSLAPFGVPNFFRYFVLSGPVSDQAYMGLYMNAPNNGTVNVTSFSKIKIKVWGPAPMFEQTNFDPVIRVTLTGPKVEGCTTGSGGSEISQNLTANLKNGAGGFYTLPLSGFTVQGLCGTDTGAANVLATLARVVVTVPGTSFNYTNIDGGNYTTGLNLGPVGFTNN